MAATGRSNTAQRRSRPSSVEAFHDWVAGCRRPTQEEPQAQLAKNDEPTEREMLFWLAGFACGMDRMFMHDAYVIKNL